MAPLLHLHLLLLLLLAFATSILASPHLAHSHARRIPASHHPIHVRVDAPSIPLPRRKRSLNRRCIPRPSNSTTSAVPSSTLAAPSSSSSTFASPSSSPLPYTAPLNIAPAPTPVSSSTPTPTPTPTPSSTSSSPPAAQTPSSAGEPSYLSGTQYGQGTWYNTGLGACGITDVDSNLIAAVSHTLFDSFPNANPDPNRNPVCGRNVNVHHEGASVTVVVHDRCVGCAETDLDLSPGAFGVLADLSAGRINITWNWA